MEHLEVSGAVRHIYIYIYIYVIRRLKVTTENDISPFTREVQDIRYHGVCRVSTRNKAEPERPGKQLTV